MIEKLSQELRVDFKVFATAERFFEVYRPSQKGCVLSEFHLPGMSGEELQSKLVDKGCQIPIVFLSADPKVPLVVSALRKKASCVLEKPASRRELRAAVCTALNRDEQSRRREAARRHLERRFSSLSHREKEILQAVLEGIPNKFIAEQLEVSIRTVESGRRNIFRKTKTKSIAELVNLTLRLQLHRDEFESRNGVGRIGQLQPEDDFQIA